MDRHGAGRRGGGSGAGKRGGIAGGWIGLDSSPCECRPHEGARMAGDACGMEARAG